MRAVGRGGGRREKGAQSHRSENNSPVLCPEDRRCCVLALRVRGGWEEEGQTFTCRRSKKLHSPLASRLLCSSPSTQPVCSRRGLSACTDEAQDQSAGRATVPTALLPALPPCVTLPHTCTRGTRSENFHLRAHTYILTSTQAHPLPLSVRGAALLILL